MTTSDDRSGWPSGFFIGSRKVLPTSAQVESFRTVPVAHAGDCMGRCIGAHGLIAYHGAPSLTLCGPALTVRVRPGDNLMIHKALDFAQPGDVVVVDGAGDLTQALVGGLMRASALAKRLSGFVIDGAIRDVAEWMQGGIAVYARGHTFRGPSKEGPGEINIPIACAGLSVNPGDLVLGDADGVLAIPVDQLDPLLPRVIAHAEQEARIRERNSGGAGDSGRFDALLRKKGCPV